MAPLHRSRFRPPIALASIVLAACGDSGGEGGSEAARYWIFIDAGSQSVTSGEVDLTGLASCDVCPPDDVQLGGCPTIQGPFPTGIEVLWSNHTTGAMGSTFHGISGRCACLFSTCWVSYLHRWLATVPLEMGPNVIEVAAFGPSDQPGSETITITRTPPAPLGLEARADAGEIELAWEPVAGADSYTVFWSETRDVSGATAHAIPDVASPFRHVGLADDTTLHYAVAAVSVGQEGPLSAVEWATAGWPTEVLPVSAGATVDAETSVATDALDHVHVHLSRQAPDGASEQNLYATDGTGPWVASQVALTSWRDADVALDATGTVHLGYLRPEGVVHAWGSAGAWSTEVVDSLGTCDASLAIDATDALHFAYRAGSSPPELRYASRASGAWLAERVDAAGLGCSSGAALLTLEVEGDGTPHLVYSDPDPGRGLRQATKRAGVWTLETIDAGPVVDSSLALEADGTPQVVFVDAQGVLRHARRQATGAWTSQRIDPEAFIATPSLALDAAGNAHVSYFEASYGGELRSATNAGGAWRVVRVAPATYSDTAVALDFHGGIHISYFDLDACLHATRRP